MDIFTYKITCIPLTMESCQIARCAQGKCGKYHFSSIWSSMIQHSWIRFDSIRFKVETNFRPRWNWSVWHSGKIWLNNYTHGNWILEISVEILLDSKRSKRRKECCTEKRSGVMKRTNGYLNVSFKATRVHLKLLKLTCKQYFQLAGCIERLVHVHIKQCIISSCTHKCSANILSH